MLALWAALAVGGSAQESRWAAELTARINANEPPGWNWVSVMPSARPKLVPSETTVLLGIMGAVRIFDPESQRTRRDLSGGECVGGEAVAAASATFQGLAN
jgi:hypothetical protein